MTNGPQEFDTMVTDADGKPLAAVTVTAMHGDGDGVVDELRETVEAIQSRTE